MGFVVLKTEDVLVDSVQ